MPSHEAVKSELFGTGQIHEHAHSFLGDYVALATGNIALWQQDDDGDIRIIKAAHAGLLQEEMTVPLILIEA